MPGKIFISYRRDDAADAAARLARELSDHFGRDSVFMDIDDLLPGQRFEEELAKALDACDVLVAVIGQRWTDLLKAKIAPGERDYVRQEIGAALQRKMLVVPVPVGREGQLPPLPGAHELPADIRDLARHQMHVVRHEHFGRDAAELAQAIIKVREARQPPRPPQRWRRLVAAAAGLGGAAGVALAAWWWWSEPGKPLTPIEERALKPGDIFRDCNLCPKMVMVPAGSFMMGSPPDEEGRPDSESPQREVKIGVIAVGQFEVTFAEWDACVAEGGCRRRPNDQGWGRGERPVIDVSWEDITTEYLPWLSHKTRKTYRLPTEAEWEYLARGVTSASARSRRYWWGDQPSRENANYGRDGSRGGGQGGRDRWLKTAPVGQFPPNPFGLHDMHGNVAEWAQDCWNETYSGAPSDGSAWTAGNCSQRVRRGGSWNGPPEFMRSAFRAKSPTGERRSFLGFRVVRVL